LFAVGAVPALAAWRVPGTAAHRAEALMVTALVLSAPWLWLCARLTHDDGASWAPSLRSALWAALIGRLALLTVDPVLSEDLWRYLWDAATWRAGLGPYQWAPAAATLDALAQSAPSLASVRSQIGHPEVPTIYPPAAQWLFAVFGLAGPSALAWRLGMIGADALVALGLARWAAARGAPPAIALGWLACPLVALEVAVGAHIDVFGVAALAWAGVAFSRGHTGRAGAALAVAAGTKLFPVVALLRGPRHAWLGALGVTAVLGAPFVTQVADMGAGLSTYAHRWRFNDGLFAVISATFERVFLAWGLHADAPLDVPEVVVTVARALVGGGSAADSRLWLDELVFASAKASAVALLVAVLGRAWAQARRSEPVFDLLGPFCLALLLVSPVVHPWYLMWALPFGLLWLASPGARAMGAAVCLWVALAVLAYVPRIGALGTGVWQSDGPWRLAEYVPVWIALALAAARGVKARNL
jgi:hypothetical protein